MPGLSPALHGGAAPRFGFGTSADQIDVSDLDRFRSLVVRRSPVDAGPPADWRRVWSGRYYDVWRRNSGVSVIEHLPAPTCARIGRMARRVAGGDARLVAAPAAARAAASPHPSAADGMEREGRRPVARADGRSGHDRGARARRTRRPLRGVDLRLDRPPRVGERGRPARRVGRRRAVAASWLDPHRRPAARPRHPHAPARAAGRRPEPGQRGRGALPRSRRAAPGGEGTGADGGAVALARAVRPAALGWVERRSRERAV